MSGRFKLVITEAWRSLGANVSTTVAATMTVLIGMFLLGLFIALGTWTVSWSDHIKRQLVVKVYFSDKATAQQRNALAARLQQSPYVKENGIKFIPKEKALEIMKKRQPELVQNLTSNPFPNSLTVTPNKGENVEKLFRSLQPPPPGVADVTDAKKTSKRVLQVAHVIEVVVVLATAVLLIASILLIANTIRLSIFSRRREIEVMKLVGATNWFIRGPFMIEGLICGLGGALLAVLLLVLGKEIALPAILRGLSDDSDVNAWGFPLISLILLASGLALGAIGSGLTIRRFLRV
jgi:cell division transport system permease protein